MEKVQEGYKLATDDSIPPLMATYKHLLVDDSIGQPRRRLEEAAGKVAECDDLPVIDLADLLLHENSSSGEGKKEEEQAAEQCRAAIVRAASEWGFFMVTNHGVAQALLDELLHEAQVSVFRRPFDVKVREPLLDLPPESYRWGTPTATCLEQLSWSEAYHIPLGRSSSSCVADRNRRTRQVIDDVSTAMSRLAQSLARVLVGGMSQGDDGGEDDMMKTTRPDTCFLRLNRYPPHCGTALVFGLCPHTDSDFLTILQQDGVGGLQLLNAAGQWLAVRPRPGALIVNVGDLLQAWSNDRYRSVEHRVVASAAQDRFSVAFFLCPAHDTVISPRCLAGGDDPPRYASFTFGEYRNQIREDVRLTGRKVGLQRFRLS